MKLGELRGAIRKFKGNPTINLYPIPNSDFGMKVTLQKTALLEELERVFPGGRGEETGFNFNSETGVLTNPSCDEEVGLTTEEKAVAFGTNASADDVVKGTLTPEETADDELLESDDDDDLLMDDDDDLMLDLDD